MADGLGVAASIIALLQLSGVVISYLKDVKDASKDCQNILLEIGNTRCLLQVLNDLSTQPSYLAVVKSLAVIHGPLDQFRSVLERLSDKIVTPSNTFAKAAKALTWSLKKDEVKELLSTLERLKSHFSLALQNDHLSLSRSIHADLAEVKRAVLLQNEKARDAKDFDTLRWLTPFKYEEMHNRACEERLHGTGQWLLENPDFVAWRDQDAVSNVIWAHGIPGAGKTVISSLVIDHLKEKFSGQNIGTGYFYCAFNNQQSQSSATIVASLLKQSALLKPAAMECVTRLHEKHANAGTYPHISELEAAFLSSIQDFQRFYLVIDALDECDADKSRGSILKVLKSFKTTSLRIFVTSRPHPDNIRNLFQDSPEIAIEASGEDIERYIRAMIDESSRAPRVMREVPGLKEEVISKIRDNAQGMFLLPRLQIQSILEKMNARQMLEALQELPLSLDKTFQATLQRIREQSKDSIDLAMQTIEWIFLAKRPFLVEELRQGLSVRPTHVELDKLGCFSPVDIVDVCLGLVILDQAEKTIRFVHFTIQEYLLTNAAEVFPSQGSQLTSACLAFLLFDEFTKGGPCPNEESFERRQQTYPFFDYASNYWHSHLKESPNEIDDERALVLLMTEPCVLSMVQNTHRDSYGDYSQRYPKLNGLHLAASLGLDRQVEALLDSGIDVDILHETEGTALHLAIQGSHDRTVSVLLQHRADLSLLNGENSTAFHLAAEVGSIEITKLLYDTKVDLSAIDSSGRTALHIAIEKNHTDICTFLIEKGMSVTSEDRFGSSILHEAAETGDLELVKLILKNGANSSTLNDSRENPAHRAAWEGHENIVRILHLHGCDIHAVDDSGSSPLHRAACRGHTETMRFLLQNGANVKQLDESGSSALHEAAEGGNAASVQLLLDYGADLKVMTENNQSVIHRACMNRQDAAVLPLLVESGALLDHAKDSDGQTPLLIAALYGSQDNVRYLVEHEADIEIAGSEGSTPLLVALDSSYDEIANFLISKGADITKVGWNGNTALHLAARSSSVAMLQFLLQNGADIKSTDKDKKTALHMVEQETDIEKAQLLILSGVDVSARDKNGHTALHDALASGNDNLILLLISKGADVLAKSESESTVFHFAAMGTYKQAVFQLLLQKGADLDTRNKNSSTPLLLAAEHNNSALIRFLIEHGADATATMPLGSTVLHLLAECDGDSESVELLIAHGADPKARKNSGVTVLHSAFTYTCENKRLVQSLVETENGADVNATHNGVSVLHLAAKNASGAVVKYLIEKGANVMAKTEKGSSVLHFAAENEDPERIIMLLAKNGADLEEKDTSGRTCLLRVGPSCRLLVKYLVEKGANVLARSNGGNTILHKADVLEDIELVKYLLDKGANSKACNILGVSVLHMAAEHGYEDTVRLLVEKGASPRYVDKKGISALHRAVKNEDIVIGRKLQATKAVVTFLLERGADINGKDKTGLTALHLAAEAGHETIVQMLIDKGADIGAVTLDGVSVLHKAVTAGLLSVVRDLLDRGAQVNAADKSGTTVLHCAIKGKLAMVDLLLEHGADVMVRNKQGVTPLKIASDESLDSMIQLLVEKGLSKSSLVSAAQRGTELEVRLLLSKGASVDSNSPDGLPPLWYAIEGGDAAVVNILLENGAGANFEKVTDKDKQTALCHAVKHRCAEVVNLLLAQGANIEQEGYIGRKPLLVAVINGDEDVVRLLLEKGADIETLTEFDITVLEFGMEMRQNAVLGLFDTETNSELAWFGLRPISMAAAHGHEAVVKLLLEKEPAKSSRSINDRMALFVAAWNGSAAVLEVLLQREMDLDFKSNIGQALLWLAGAGGHEAATKLLLEKGADEDFKYEGSRTLLSYASERKHKAVVELLEGIHGMPTTDNDPK